MKFIMLCTGWTCISSGLAGSKQNGGWEVLVKFYRVIKFVATYNLRQGILFMFNPKYSKIFFSLEQS